MENANNKFSMKDFRPDVDKSIQKVVLIIGVSLVGLFAAKYILNGVAGVIIGLKNIKAAMKQ
ncbi:MAG: hypothetical protein H0X63_06010 [Flavobacteriales bacterium]|nr:hypothetical protein [Flavobacteriales bacterium]